jgi:hypothetical protein
MTSVVITGMARDRAAALAADAAAGRIEVLSDSDYEGAIAVQSGQVDYYIGICQSGAGGALALAIGLIGSKRARTVAPAGRPADDDLIAKALADGIVAFGVCLDHVDKAVPAIVRGILDHRA